MKIKFLGTSAGWPLPRLGCKCEICSSKNPKDTRTRTQILIDDTVLLDAGPETYSHLRPLNVASKLEAILISHAHPDHVLGLWDLPHIYGRNENNVDKIKLYITQPVLNNIKSTIFSQFQPIVISVEKSNIPFNIGSAKVTYFPVIHGKTPAFGIKYKQSLRSSSLDIQSHAVLKRNLKLRTAGLKDGKFLAYIPDFNKILPSSQKVIRDCHLLIIDGSSLGKVGQSPTHISIQDGIIIAKKLKAKSIYFVHIGHKTATHEELNDYLRQNAGPNFHVAYDGLEINL